LRGTDEIALTVFGDGALNQGAAHESLNIAGLYQLPMIFLCENNLYAEMTPLSGSSGQTDLASRAAGYGFDGVRVDGNDVVAFHKVLDSAVAKARKGGGPTLIEAMTYRTCGHYQLDPGTTYRSKEEVAEWETKSPMKRLAAVLEGGEVKPASQVSLVKIEEDAREQVAVALAFALESPLLEEEEAERGVFVSSPVVTSKAEGADVKITFSAAVKSAISQEMHRDERVILFGEDVAHHGGMFQVTKGLLEEFGPKRVFDTPISEAGFLGMGLGAALTGFRPVIELMFFDFSLVAMDQIFNQIAKTTYMSGGLKLPLTIRTQGGGYKGAAAQHSQMLEALFVHIPGLKVVTASNPADAKGLLAAAIRDDSPVLFIEHKQLYPTEGMVPSGECVGELGTASVLREGKDLTICSYSWTAQQSLEAANDLANEGIEAELIDLRTLNPLDFEAVKKSLSKTHRLVIAHEGHLRCGIGADLAAQLQEHCFDELDAPILRVGAADVPIPFAKHLEDIVLPSSAKIAAKARELMR
ncbi:MAG: dehydrogenase E1 component subunit alpha/beta, partial [Fimbriimonadaceae bacterium]